ncbi:MAG: hypothetical protein LBD18_00025 [Treponema sp.]|jgi:hypothetical protein|nr:hypothetical protein [Treponema sp.]
MKRTYLIAILFVLIAKSAFGQNTERKFTIQTNPVLFIYDFFAFDFGDEFTFFIMDLEGQYKINNHLNASLTLSFLINNRTNFVYYDESIYGDDINDITYEENIFQFNVKPMLIFRPLGTGLKGFYLGFYPNIGWKVLSNEYESHLFTELGFGFSLGYKWIFRSGFTLQLGTGIGKTFSIPKKQKDYVFVNSDGRITINTSDLHLLDFKLGFSF